MKLVRYNDNRLGRMEGDEIIDVTEVLTQLPSHRWPLPRGDQFVANLPNLLGPLGQTDGKRTKLSEVKLLSPIANPDKIFGAALNYRDHVDESNADEALNFGSQIAAIEKNGLFLKANSSLVGASNGISLGFGDNRVDHEVELVAIIGKTGKRINRANALDYVAGYSVGLDISVRGTQERSFRKSADSYAVLGPMFVTADEIANPNDLNFWIEVNGERRQASNTRYLIYNVELLVELASSVCTLYPGDLIYTGTPAGVGQLLSGDKIVATVEGLGVLTTKVSA